MRRDDLLLPPYGRDREVSHPLPLRRTLQARLALEDQRWCRPLTFECGGERYLGMQVGPKPSCSITLHLSACNLWTQESHANRIQALMARPETDYGCHLVPIGIEFGLPKEHR